MGWSDYGIYDGDCTKSLHFYFIYILGFNSFLSTDQIEDIVSSKKTVVPKNLRYLLVKNYTRLEKWLYSKYKDRKFFMNEDEALEWQMVLAFYLDNKVKPPKKIYEMGKSATEYLMGQHAEDFDNPSKRKARLRYFLKRAERAVK